MKKTAANRGGTLTACSLALALAAASGADARKAPVAVPLDTVRFQGTFADTSFDRAAPVRLEVLETGDTLSLSQGAAFSVRLPVDSLWNLCFSGRPAEARPGAPADSGAAPGDSLPATAAAAGDSAAGSAGEARLEKCFELRYAGSDSVFRSAIGEGPATVVLEPEAAPAALAPASDAGAEEEGDQGTFRPDDAVQLKKVLVRAQRAPKRSLGKSTVSAKLIKRMPGLAEADVIRSIQALPGVVASSDFSTKIYVRGGGSDQNLILLDRAVVYSPVHFFGLFSTFLVEGIDEVNFYKGGFPPEYGNRLSSVLDIKSRTGGKDTGDTWFKGSSIKISTFASQAHTEGRQGPFRWLLAGRRTYIDQMLGFLRSIDATELDLPYAFYDLQGSGYYDLGGGNSFLLSFYQGRDELVFYPFEVDWGNTVIPANLNLRLTTELSSRTSLSYSLFSQGFGLESIFKFYNRIATYNLTQSFEYSGLEDHRLTLGGDFNWMQTIFTNEQPVVKLRLRDYTGFFLNNLFAQDKWTSGSSEVTAGARLSWSSTLPAPYLEPRLSYKYRLTPEQSLDLHAGYYVQYINSINFADQESLNEFYYPAKEVAYRTVNPTTSLLLSAGYGVEKIRGAWDITLEGYYKTLNHLAVFASEELPDSLQDRSDLTLGDNFKEANGYSIGFEVSLRRPEGLLFGGLSYSNGTSVIREDNSTEAYFPRWHHPHSFKADLAINWRGKDGIWNAKKKGRYFRSSTTLKYATGLPYTEVLGYVPVHFQDQSPGESAGGPNPEFGGDLATVNGNRNAAFVPAYLRWDAKVVDWGREGKWNFSWTILNLTNHENIFFYSYDQQTNPPERVVITQFPFFPMLVNYEYYF